MTYNLVTFDVKNSFFSPHFQASVADPTPETSQLTILSLLIVPYLQLLEVVQLNSPVHAILALSMIMSVISTMTVVMVPMKLCAVCLCFYLVF